MKYIIPALSILGLIATAVSPQIQGFLGLHPSIAAILVALNGILGSFAPQPHK